MAQFEVIARAVILERGRILLCRARSGGHYFFPGGHAEFGEPIVDGLIRELREELRMTPKRIRRIGVVENIFRKDARRHEINFLFHVVPKQFSSRTRENHIAFSFVPVRSLRRMIVLPVSLRDAVRRWIKDQKSFIEFLSPR